MGVSRYKGEYKASEKKREYFRLKHIQDMDLAIAQYSNDTNACAICGENRREFLTLDHINADKKNWNKSHGIHEESRGSTLARSLRVRNWPKGIQILCYNCNQQKGSHITNKGKNTKDRSHITVISKTCGTCKTEKEASEFRLSPVNKDGLSYDCNVCHGKYTKQRDLNIKQKVIDIYGGKCSCCGELRLEFLSIEHTKGDGTDHHIDIAKRYGLKLSKRRRIGSFCEYILKDIAQGITWDGLTIHCYNCNSTKGVYGYCPHEVERGEVILDSQGKPIRIIERKQHNNDISNIIRSG